MELFDDLEYKLLEDKNFLKKKIEDMFEVGVAFNEGISEEDFMDRLFLLSGAVEFWTDSQAKLKSGKDAKSEYSDPKYGKVTLQTSMRMFIEGQTDSMKEFYLSTMSTLNEKGGNILGKRRHRD